MSYAAYGNERAAEVGGRGHGQQREVLLHDLDALLHLWFAALHIHHRLKSKSSPDQGRTVSPSRKSNHLTSQHAVHAGGKHLKR